MHDCFTSSSGHFQKIHLRSRPVISLELGITLVSQNKKKGESIFLFYFEPQNIDFRIHITKIRMKFPFQTYITLHSLI